MKIVKGILVLILVFSLTGCIQIVVPSNQGGNTKVESATVKETQVKDTQVIVETVNNNVKTNAEPVISQEKAVEIALAKVPGATKDQLRIKFEYDDGMPEYEVKIYKDGMKYEMDIDATTGRITDYEEKVDK